MWCKIVVNGNIELYLVVFFYVINFIIYIFLYVTEQYIFFGSGIITFYYPCWNTGTIVFSRFKKMKLHTCIHYRYTVYRTGTQNETFADFGCGQEKFVANNQNYY
jgi:hypothetical protein